MIFKKLIEKIQHHHHHSHNDVNQASSSSEYEPTTISNQHESSTSSAGSVANRNLPYQLTDSQHHQAQSLRTRSTILTNESNRLHKNATSSQIYNEAENENQNFYASSTSSYSDNTKFENDFDDLHLHHDHNTKHLFRNIHHSDKLVNRLNEMRK